MSDASRTSEEYPKLMIWTNFEDGMETLKYSIHTSRTAEPIATFRREDLLRLAASFNAYGGASLGGSTTTKTDPAMVAQAALEAREALREFSYVCGRCDGRGIVDPLTARPFDCPDCDGKGTWPVTESSELAAFEAAIRADQRQRDALICEAEARSLRDDSDSQEDHVADRLAKLIREQDGGQESRP